MLQDSAYVQLLNLIAARSQQWLRNRIELMPNDPASDERLAEMAIAAHICTGLKGADAPLRAFLRHRMPDDVSESIFGRFQKDKLKLMSAGDAGHAASSAGYCFPFLASDISFPAAAFAMTDRSEAFPFDDAEAFLRRPIPDDQLDEGVIETYAWALAITYRFGAERPRFASARTYGAAFGNCLRLADWAQCKGKLLPLVQMIFCLCLIDPDHDVREMLADVISSQRPDGSFPARIGFGTADQGDEAFRPTLATVVALHMAIHRRWRRPRPGLRIAA